MLPNLLSSRVELHQPREVNGPTCVQPSVFNPRRSAQGGLMELVVLDCRAQPRL